MASLERVELVTSKVEGVPDQLKTETLSQQTVSLFVPDYTANTVEILLDLIYTGESRSTGKIDPLSKQFNITNLYKDLGFEPNLMGGLPVVAELDQIPLEKNDLSVDHIDIKKEEYFEECDVNVNESNKDLTLGIMRTDYDKVSEELIKLEVKNQVLEEMLLKMKEAEVNRLSSAEREVIKCKVNLEEKEKLLEDSEVQKNKYLKKLRITERRLGNKEFRIKALLKERCRWLPMSIYKQVRMESNELKDLNQKLEKEKNVLTKKIANLRKENISIQKKQDLYEHEILQNEFGEISSDKKDLEDRTSYLKEMNQTSQQKIVEFDKEKDKEKQGRARGNVPVTTHSSAEELKVNEEEQEAESSALSSNVNNNAPGSKKRHLSEPDEGQNKVARK